MSPSSTSSIEIKLAALQRAYLNDLPKKLAEIEKLWLMMAGPNWQGIHAQDLHRLLHSLAGSGATFGAPEVSQAARALEQKFKTILSENRTASEFERSEMSDDFRELDRIVKKVIENTPARKIEKSGVTGKQYPNDELIYVLSDELGAIQRYRDELTSSGFIIESFSDASEFLLAIKQSLPRAVIVDVAAPENSFRQLEHIHNTLTEDQHPPAILYASVQNDIETRLAALKIGASRFFTKPVNFPKLIGTLNGLTQIVPREAYRILIVDDVETLSEFYAASLEKAGFETRTINNPLYALTEIEKFEPDLVLMDVYMPVCSGLELAAVIRQDDKYAEMPIVFLSTETDLDKQMAAMNLGGDDFLTKPIAAEHLTAAILARAKRARWLSRLRNELQTALHINERQKIDLQRKEERLKRSQRYSNIGTWDWSIKTGDIYWSERVMPLYGLHEGEVTTTYDEFIKKVHPDDREQLIDAIQQCLQQHKEYEVEHRVIWPDQSIHWLLERGDVQRDVKGEATHMLGVVQDVTNRKKLEQTLSEQKSLLAMLQQGLSQYVSSHSLHDTGRFMLDNLLTITQSEYGFIGEVLYDDKGSPYIETHVMSNVPHDGDASGYFSASSGQGLVITQMENILCKVVESGRPFILGMDDMESFRTGFPEGHLVPETFVGVPIFFGDDLVGIYGLANRLLGYDDNIMQFLTPFNATYGVIINAYRLTTQDKLIKADLNVAKEDAEKANKAKSDFLNHMSHELRTPMNAILGFGQLMESDDNDPLSDTHKDYLHEMIKAGRHLLDLIDQVLDLARIEAGKLHLAIDSVLLSEVIDECRALIEPLASKRQIQLIVANESCFEVWVQVDRLRLKQILLNLLSNAIKYNHDDGEIFLDCERLDNDFLRIAVRDTGHGISAEKMETLFEAFNRLGAEKSNIEGTGIGLMISRQMIEMMAGRLEVESKEGQGSCFAFTVPVSPSS